MKVKYNKPSILKIMVKGQDPFTVLPTWQAVPEDYVEMFRNDADILSIIDSGLISINDKNKLTDKDLLDMIKSESVISTLEEMLSTNPSDRVKKSINAKINKLKRLEEMKAEKDGV